MCRFLHPYAMDHILLFKWFDPLCHIRGSGILINASEWKAERPCSYWQPGETLSNSIEVHWLHLLLPRLVRHPRLIKRVSVALWWPVSTNWEVWRLVISTGKIQNGWLFNNRLNVGSSKLDRWCDRANVSAGPTASTPDSSNNSSLRSYQLQISLTPTQPTKYILLSWARKKEKYGKYIESWPITKETPHMAAIWPGRPTLINWIN